MRTDQTNAAANIPPLFDPLVDLDQYIQTQTRRDIKVHKSVVRSVSRILIHGTMMALESFYGA